MPLLSVAVSSSAVDSVLRSVVKVEEGVLVLVLAVVLESAQSAVFDGRGRDVGDGIADVVGLISAGFAFRALYLEWPVGKRIL